MFMTSRLAVVFIVIEYLIGAIIGTATAALIYRSRTTSIRAIRAALIAGLAFAVGSGLAGWADSHAAFYNGRRLDIAPWGEDLRLRNFIAENGVLISVALSIGASALVNLRSKDPNKST